MATVNATVDGVHLIQASNSYDDGTKPRKAYVLTLSFAVYTAGADSAQLTGVPTIIGNFTKNGKTFNVRSAAGFTAGRNATGVAVYTSPTITNSSGTLTFDLCSSVTGLEADTSASKGVQIIVVGDES